MHFPAIFQRKTNPPLPAGPPADQKVGRVEFRHLVATRQLFYEKGLKLMATCLPRTDAELHRWLEQAIEQNDALMFIHTVSAAAISGRRLQASLLPRGACMMRTDDEFAWIAWHSEGNVTGALLEAARGGGLRPMREATALFYAAAWWQKSCETPVPAEILGRGRELTRNPGRDASLHATLGALSCLVGSEELLGMASAGQREMVREKCEKLKDSMLGILRPPFSEIVPEGIERGFSLGRTMRRAVDDIGRNERCRCGSGQKYKRCCEKADQRRWRQSSDVAGLTTTELGDELDAHLSKARLQKMEAHELAKLEPEKVPADLIGDYLKGLAAFKRYGELIKAFKKVGVEGEREPDWIASFSQPVKDWRPEIALRLLKLHPRRKEMLPALTPATRILLGSQNPGKFCRTVEDEVIAALRSGDVPALRSVALGVLYSPMHALGILVARSVLPLAEDAAEVFEEILLTRDKLNLPVDDEFAGFMEERAARRRKSSGQAASREAEERYEAKAEEARRLHEEKRKVERELALREKRACREAAANVPVLAADTQVINDLRTHVKTLEARLRENSAEQVADRRAREKAEEDCRVLREATAMAKSIEKGEEEEDFQAEGNQPLRLIQFPRGFRETLVGFQKHVGRATMNRLGRLASGEPEAFKGLKPLKAYPGVLRARVSDKHRLLFCLEPDCIRVVDLIWRADLDRRIERLKASGLPPIG